MDYLSVLGSVNKLAVFCFLLTFGFIIYEFMMYMKERKEFKNPHVPQFDPSAPLNRTVPGPVGTKTQKPLAYNRKNRLLPTAIAIFLLIVFAGIIVFYAPKTPDTSLPPSTSELAVLNEGVTLYTPEWDELQPEDLSTYKNKMIYVGLKSTQPNMVDKARIRVNADVWTPKDETTLFNEDKNEYYIQYVIASDTASLKIQGQLHYKSDGWPE